MLSENAIRNLSTVILWCYPIFSPLHPLYLFELLHLNQLLCRARMAVSRVIFPSCGVDIVTTTIFVRSLDRSPILIVVTRNKAQLQNERVRARVYAFVFLIGYAQFTDASCFEYFAHPCARITNEMLRKGGAKTKGGRKWISMSAVWFEFFPLSLFSLSLSLSLSLFSISFYDRNFLLSCITSSLPRSGPRACVCRRYGLVPLHYGCVIIIYSFSMGT